MCTFLCNYSKYDVLKGMLSILKRLYGFGNIDSSVLFYVFEEHICGNETRIQMLLW